MKVFYHTLLILFFLATSAAAVVNINTGSLEELTSLPGIGPVKAESIIKYREEKGMFKKVEELKNVYGIGDKIIARLKDDLTVGEDSPAVASTSVDKESKEATQKDQEKEETSSLPSSPKE
ncbi:MAG: helix-hairpin-helix domain-containing protein [Candidatus Electrothrix sp. ATG1]|nr:helix-hairpin-helix domain-containing protein [Candidatus Electrothrix sp. ATG1]MCI5209621.1 helix-hairpin-helix domain-containing protein [Candidatus Electrothrix sp. ATG2]